MSIGGASAAQRRSAIDGRTTRREGYTLSQKAQTDRGDLRLAEDHRRVTHRE
jgi:hypothetical protein